MTNSTKERAQWTGLMMAAALLSPACGFAQTAGGPVARPNVTSQNIEAPGNLAATNTLKCTTFDQMRSSYTPPDIYPAFADCVQNGRYPEATQLFMLAGAYGTFDTLRVSDESARDAKTVLVMQSMNAIDPAKKAAFKAALNAYLTGPGHAEGCAAVRRLGPPTYYPAYMIQHGMAVLTGSNQPPLITPFDAAAAWQMVLTTYLQCPA